MNDRLRTFRDATLIIVGCLLLSYEAIFRDEVREPLLLLYGAMMGLPLVLRRDENDHR